MANEKDFETLFKANYKRFTAVAYGYSKQKHIAEEIVQDVFVDFWNRLERGEKILNHEAYLRRAVMYRSFDVIKAEKKHAHKVDIDQIDNLSLYDDLNPESQFISQEKLKFLQNTIDTLPERTRQIFMLSRFEKMSYKEISKKTEINQKTVEYHISKALQLIRKALISLFLLSIFTFI